MERMVERGFGLDVHKATVTACVRVPAPQGGREQHVRTFGTMAADLLALRDWLEAHGVTHVAMESTGVYWNPLFYVLEEAITCVLVNAAHIKQRDVTRYRKVLIQERTRGANRLHKVLQDAGIKLASVARDILGASGRAMLDALVHGTTDPAVLADLARGRLRAKLPALRAALAGRFRPHHAFLVAQLLAHLDYLDEAITTLSTHIEELLAPFGETTTRLDAIPGVNQRTIEVVVAELGLDMRVFPSDRHLASWVGLCPGNNESAGKRQSGRTRKGNRWLRAALTEAALGAIHAKDSPFRSRYYQVMPHRGHNKAVVAVAHALLRTIYHLLAHQTTYQNPGPDYLDRRQAQRAARRAIRLLERQG